MGALESRLPRDLLERGSLRGNEYAWPVDDIPHVINAAKLARLINIGGQLQFRMPDGGVCECYWVEVDTFKSVSAELPYREKVARSAEVALADFTNLALKFDFLEEGRRSFETLIRDGEKTGAVLAEMMCFVWYLSDDDEHRKVTIPAWREIHVGFEGDDLIVGGIEIWRSKWRPTGEPHLNLPHPAHRNQIHRYNIYEVMNAERTIRFAASELSNGVWGFYAPE